MPFPIRVHFDNSSGFQNPYLWQWADGSSRTGNFAPNGQDCFGPFFDLEVLRSECRFKFKEGPGTAGPWEPDNLNRFYSWLTIGPGAVSPAEIWAKGDKAFVYHVEPRTPEPESAETLLGGWRLREFHDGRGRRSRQGDLSRQLRAPGGG